MGTTGGSDCRSKAGSGGVYSVVARKSVTSRPPATVTTSPLINLLTWLGGGTSRRKRRLFHRDVQVADAARNYFCDLERTRSEQEGFAELLLKLDADPIAHTWPIFNPPVPGLRWAALGEKKVIVHFDPSHDRVRVVLVE